MHQTIKKTTNNKHKWQQMNTIGHKYKQMKTNENAQNKNKWEQTNTNGNTWKQIKKHK